MEGHGTSENLDFVGFSSEFIPKQHNRLSCFLELSLYLVQGCAMFEGVWSFLGTVFYTTRTSRRRFWLLCRTSLLVRKHYRQSVEVQHSL